MRIELARSVAASMNRQHEVAEADTWLAALALVDGDTGRADRLALGAAGVLVHSEVAGYQHDLTTVLAAVAAASGRLDDAAIVASLAAAAPPPTRTAAITTMLQPLLPTDFVDIAGLDAGPVPLVDAIRHATRGRASRTPQRFGWQSLTQTERSVVALASEGLTNAAIGRRLHIGAGTVKTHLSHIYAKLGVANRTELATAAAQRPEPATPTDTT
jgi:DNA-binding CsgD family transcriptional regulator